jgi:hypothetical protein
MVRFSNRCRSELSGGSIATELRYAVSTEWIDPLSMRAVGKDSPSDFHGPESHNPGIVKDS